MNSGARYSLLKQIGRSKVRSFIAVAPSSKFRVKHAFAVSQYSGELGPGRFTNYASYIPPFRIPKLRHAGASDDELKMFEEDRAKLSAMSDELMKLNSVTSPKAQLTGSQKVGGPRAAAPPGPSIQQIAKPVGFGRPLAGATKTI